jgi:hypothetical protein
MKANKTMRGWEASNYKRRKNNQRVALIQLHRIKSLTKTTK